MSDARDDSTMHPDDRDLDLEEPARHALKLFDAPPTGRSELDRLTSELRGLQVSADEAE